jgi:hypothetical protein
MFETKEKIRARLMDAFDLAVDFATLGEYGLEPLDAAEATRPGERCELDGQRTGWEALASPRRGDRCAPAPVAKPRAARARG